MKKINAEIIADSADGRGNRITSFILTYPRFIHSELMTHRMFSRNSASSRAIPFNKMVKMVEEDPFIPIAWQKDHSGMQGTEYFVDLEDISNLEYIWRYELNVAIGRANTLNKTVGVTKQLCNRLLEPFMWHTVLVTATEFDNFFNLRCPQYIWEEPSGNPHVYKSKKDALKDIQWRGYDISDLLKYTDIDWQKIDHSQAEIHIQALAESMWDAMKENTPKQLEENEWHIPFDDRITSDVYEAAGYTEEDPVFADFSVDQLIKLGLDLRLKVSTARCARLSYNTFDGEIDYDKDIKLHDQLLASGHASPFEHCCRALTNEEYENSGKLVPLENGIIEFQKGWVDNFKGYKSYRRILNFS